VVTAYALSFGSLLPFGGRLTEPGWSAAQPPFMGQIPALASSAAVCQICR
jgi:hypothetical protein